MIIHGEGSIQPYDGKSPRRCRKWRIFFHTEDGLKTRVVVGSKSDANAAKRDFRAELEAQRVGVDSASFFTEYAESWLDYRLKMAEIRPSTGAKYAANIRRLSSVFCCKVSSMDPKSIKKGMAALRDEGLSGTYLNSLFMCLKQIMESAVDDGLITRNPCSKLKPPKSDTSEKLALTESELSDLLDMMDALPIDGRVMAIYMMVNLGLRRGEALALRWSDVSEGAVSVSRSVAESTRTETSPKSKAGVRRLPMTPRLKAKMDAWRKVCPSDYVCCDTQGCRLHAQNLRRWWIKNGIPDVTLHQLRHSNLTMMAGRLGAFDLSKWAGWSSVDPARVYVHADMDRLSGAADSVTL